MTADSDFVPVMKVVRREGVQIIPVSMHGQVEVRMRAHADIVRSVTSL